MTTKKLAKKKGIVTSEKMDKTIDVAVRAKKMHPK
jgi:ribosomal protein S17